MNAGHSRDTIVRGIEAKRRYCTIEELARAIHVPPGYLEALLIRYEDDFGDLFVQQIATALETTVDAIIKAGR